MIAGVGKNVENQNSHTLLVGVWIGTTILENYLEISIKAQCRPTYVPTHVTPKIYTRLFIAALFIISPNWKQTKWTTWGKGKLNGGVIQQNPVHLYRTTDPCSVSQHGRSDRHYPGGSIHNVIHSREVKGQAKVMVGDRSQADGYLWKGVISERGAGNVLFVAMSGDMGIGA